MRSLSLLYTYYTYYYCSNRLICILCSLRRTIVQTIQLRCSTYYAYYTYKPLLP
jgi:hypothetical protein